MYELTDKHVFEVVRRDLDEWKYFYPNYPEMMTRNTPKALGKYVVIKAYVDSNYVGKMVNRRLHSGVIIYVNNAPIIWYSKEQNTFKITCLGLEFVALRIATDMLVALRKTLRCFVLNVDGPT